MVEEQTRTGASAGWLGAEKSNALRPVVAAAVVAILIVVFAASTYFKTTTSHVRAYSVWAVFHYYLGAKYFPEVGYFDLYPCALDADRQGAGIWNTIGEARDMETCRMVPRSSLPACPRQNFTDERWAGFSRDVEFFAQRTEPDYFKQAFSDKGFNPPPSWVAVARPLAEAIPLSMRGVAELAFNLDVIAVLIGVWMVWRSRGGLLALLTGGLAVLYFGSFGRIGGNFLQYFWFPLLVAAILAWARRRPAVSGAMLGAAAGLQIFPVFFALPIVLRGAIEFFRRKEKGSDWARYLRFTGALSAVMLASILLGGLAGRGMGAWGEWQRKISIHSAYLRGEIFNIGLANLTAAAVSTDHEDAEVYAEDVPNTLQRLDTLERHIRLYYGLAGIFVAMWVVGVTRAAADDLFGYGFLILYAAVALSPFYYLSLALAPLMFWNASRILRSYAVGGAVVLAAINLLLFPGQYVITFGYLPHLLSAISIALFFFGLGAIGAVLGPAAPPVLHWNIARNHVR